MYYLSVTCHLSFTCDLSPVSPARQHLGPITCQWLDRRGKQFSGHELPPWNRYIIIMVQKNLDARKNWEVDCIREQPQTFQVNFAKWNFQTNATNKRQQTFHWTISKALKSIFLAATVHSRRNGTHCHPTVIMDWLSSATLCNTSHLKLTIWLVKVQVLGSNHPHNY